MKSSVFLITLSLWATQVYAQRFIPTQQLGTGRSVESMLFQWENDQFILLGNNPVTRRQSLILSGTPNVGFRMSNTNLTMPDVEYSQPSFMFFNGMGWCGSINNIFVSSGFDGWTPKSIAETGREVNVQSITPFSPPTALVTAHSYIVTRVDSSGGTIGKWTEDYSGVLYYIIGNEIRKVATLPHESSPISNAVRTFNGAICVALRINPEQKYALAIYDLNGEVRYVDAPSGMPSKITPSYIIRTEDSKIYAFYSGITGGGNIPPSMLIYNEATGISTWHQLPQQGANLLGAVAVGSSKVLAHTFHGIASIDGTSIKVQQILHPTLNYAMMPIGISRYGADSVAISFQEGLMLMPIEGLLSTSVVEESKPGRIVRAPMSTVTFEQIVDGSENVSWHLYDSNGRLVEQGQTEVGQTEISVEFAGKPQGMYILHLRAGNRHLMLEKMIYME